MIVDSDTLKLLHLIENQSNRETERIIKINQEDRRNPFLHSFQKLKSFNFISSWRYLGTNLTKD